MKNTLPFFLLVATLAGCATHKSNSVPYVSETLPVSRATLKAYGTLAFAPVTENAPAFTFFTHHSKFEAAVTNTLNRVIASLPLQPQFNQRLADLALRDHQTTIRTAAGPPPADTLITVKQFSHGLLRAEGTNPPVMLHASILVTAHRRRDGELLALVPLDYRSRAHHLKEWAANDAAIFRAELETFRQRCAATVVHWLFDGKE